MDFKSMIRTIEDFPKPGISFKDITTLLKDKEAFHAAIETIARHYEGKQ
ncbi:MAG: adenine phosphoribosyltransferase, partial [Bacillota bacterium]